nr:biopolymer transporter ExbD [Methylonatrum kenyense]
MRGRRNREPEINLTPLIDVVFLMLIFFMVSTTFQHDADLSIQLPEAGIETGPREATTMHLSISADGEYALDGRILADGSRETIVRALEQAREEDPERHLIVRADARTPHQNVVRAMEAAGLASISRLSFATLQGDGSE